MRVFFNGADKKSCFVFNVGPSKVQELVVDDTETKLNAGWKRLKSEK